MHPIFLPLDSPNCKFVWQIFPQHLTDCVLRVFSIKSAVDIAQQIAFEHHCSAEIVAACVAFITILGQDSTSVRLHVSVAAVISQFQQLSSTSGLGSANSQCHDIYFDV